MIFNTLIESGNNAGAFNLTFKSSYVETSRTSSTEISFSNLDVASDEVLAGVELVKTGGFGTGNGDVNMMLTIRDGSGWITFHPIDSGNSGENTLVREKETTFVKSGETGGTISALSAGFLFLEGTYRVYPLVSKASAMIGTPNLIQKSSHVSATRTSATKISISGLDVASDETLAGIILTYQGTSSTVATNVNSMYVLKNGSGWDCCVPQSINGALIISISNLSASFVQSGNGGTITTQAGVMEFMEGTYYAVPLVMNVE